MKLKEHEKIVDRLVQDLNGNVFGIGKKLPSERDLTKRFGCSRMTVRSALEQLENSGILARLQGKGTFVVNLPNQISKRPISKVKAIQVGLVFFNTPLSPGYAAMIDGIRKGLSEQWAILSIWNLKLSVGQIQESDLEVINACDAFILAGDYSSSDLVWFARQYKPMVVLGWAGDEILQNIGKSNVQIYHDEFNSFRQATEHLLSQGYSRPAILSGSIHRAYQARYEGFCFTLKNHGIDPAECLHIVIDPSDTRGNINPARVRPAIDKLFSLRNRFDSLINTSFREVLGEVYRRGLKIPNDFALIEESSTHDKTLEEFRVTELLSDHGLIGRLAGERILDQVKSGEGRRGHLAVPSELIVRHSTVRKDISNKSPVL